MRTKKRNDYMKSSALKEGDKKKAPQLAIRKRKSQGRKNA